MTQTQYNDAVLLGKDASVKIGVAISNKLTLGEPIDKDLFLLMVVQNALYALLKGVTVHTEAQQEQLAERISKVAVTSIRHL